MRARNLLLLVAIVAGTYTPPAAACSCGGDWKPFCERLPASAQSTTTAVFLGTVESVYPTKAQDKEMMDAYFRSGGKRWPPEDPEELVKYWGAHITAAEADSIRKNEPAASRFRYNRRLIRLRVDEGFVGSPGDTLELLSGSGECCDCSPPFGLGDQYLVIAHRNENRWSTSVCSGTSMAQYARLDIAALRAWKQGKTMQPAILGTIRDVTRRPGVRSGESRSVSDLRVHLSGAGIEREARTDADGIFIFEELAPDQYRVDLVEPGWQAEYNWNPLSQKINLTASACARPYFTVKQTQSAIRGRLIGASGVSLGGHAVEVIPVATGTTMAARNRGTRTNAKGEYNLGEIEPGEYRIGLNVSARPLTGKSPAADRAPHSPYPPTYYPGVTTRETAQVFRIERGQTIDLADWTLPTPLKEIEFTGRVLAKDGSPAAGARVVLTEPGLSMGYLQRSQPTGPDGRFSVWGLEGVEYRSAAIAPAGGRTFAWKLGLFPSKEPVDITLDESGTALPPPFTFDSSLRGLVR
ncbi:MAG: hypothetical protein U0Q16_37510 [Bryobacteraceae bacterium]